MRVHDMLTIIAKALDTVQAGTPMTVTGNGTLFRNPGQGVSIFCPEISRGSGGGAPGCTPGEERTHG